MSASEELGKKHDYTNEFQQLLPQAQAVAASGNVEAGCELLLNLEKQARLANDIPTLKLVVAAILQLCAHYKRWELLKDHILLIAKRRAQKSSAVTVLVHRAMDLLTDTPSDAIKMDLIHALRTVADGKIFLEKERATLTQLLSQMHEARGEIDAAATILQEVHVETFGAMTKLEKTVFILEQVRLTLAKNDFVRAAILAKKILRRTLNEAGFDDCKRTFYALMVQLDTHENNILELCRHWLAILETTSVKAEETQWRNALTHAAVFAVLAPHSNLQRDLLYTIEKHPLLEHEPAFGAILKKFTTDEIIGFPLQPQAEHDALTAHAVFAHLERGTEWREMLHLRVTEHNIRVVAKHYERIRLPHLATMLGLSEDLTERSISTLVSDGSIFAKIDRPAKLVSFVRPLSPEEHLSNWSSDIAQLLRLVETTCHLVNKENMIHKV